MSQAVVVAVDPSLEAARYALIRRLIPLLYPRMVESLQPIGMICAVLDHKQGAGTANEQCLQEGIGKIDQLTHDGIYSCLNVISWLNPNVEALTEFHNALSDCLHLIQPNLTFRNFSIQNDIAVTSCKVSEFAVREVLTAALMATTDSANGEDTIALTALQTQDALEVSIELRQGDRATTSDEASYRPISWHDVSALAMSHGMTLEHKTDSTVMITFPTK